MANLIPQACNITATYNCVESVSQCEPGDIRLEGAGQNPTAGHVQICDNDRQWREVCDRGWDERDARVACRKLGFSDRGIVHNINVSYCRVIYM